MSAVKPIDPVDQDWAELSSLDDWGVRAVYDFGARELMARELERIAAKHAEHATEERRRANLLRNGSPKWQYEASIATYQELNAFARQLRRRAADLRGVGDDQHG